MINLEGILVIKYQRSPLMFPLMDSLGSADGTLTQGSYCSKLILSELICK